MVHAEGVEMGDSVAFWLTRRLVPVGCGPQCGRLPNSCQAEQVHRCGGPGHEMREQKVEGMRGPASSAGYGGRHVESDWDRSRQR